MAAPPHGHPAPRPAAMPHPVGRPALPPGGIHPQLMPQGHVPGGQAMTLNNSPFVTHAGPKPLLTNPHPTTTPRPVGRTAATSGNIFQQAAANNAAALSAAVAAGKDPQAVALYLASQNNWGRGNYWGWGGYGWGGYGPSGWFGFGSFGYPGWGYGGLGFGFGYHSGPWAFGIGYNFGYSPVIAYAPAPVFVETPFVAGNPPLVPEGELPPPAVAEKPATPTEDFAAKGQEQFLSGNYAEAAKTLKHAVVDDPKNGPLLALTGEAYWAAGSYNEAAGAIQQSLLATPEADWAAVANRAARLIPAEAVGKLATDLGKKEAPEMRFLAAYQSFGAGKYDEATAHLDVLLKAAPDDQVAKKLREQAVKLAGGK